MRRVRAFGSKSTGAKEIESSPGELTPTSSAIVAIKSVVDTTASVVLPGETPGPATTKGRLMPPCQAVLFVQPSNVAYELHGVVETKGGVPLSTSRKT